MSCDTLSDSPLVICNIINVGPLLDVWTSQNHMFRLVEGVVQYVQLRLLLVDLCATNLQTCYLEPCCLGPSSMLVMNPQQLTDTLNILLSVVLELAQSQ